MLIYCSLWKAIIFIFFLNYTATMTSNAQTSSSAAAMAANFDSRTTLSRQEARDVYDAFAITGHAGGKDAGSGYGGPAVTALLDMADLDKCDTVLDYGCGQGKLAELVLDRYPKVNWRGVDQSPKMVEAFQKRCLDRFGPNRCSVDLLQSGEPTDVRVEPQSLDRFISTYCLDLLSEEDMYKVLDLAELSLKPDGKLLLAGITWGYKHSFKTAIMTLCWEIAYRAKRRKVGGCRPQLLAPYLEAKGWRIVQSKTTLPASYPWMSSEVIMALPPLKKEG